MNQILILIALTLAINAVTLFGLNWLTNGRVGFGNEKVAPAARAFMVYSAMSFLLTLLFGNLALALGSVITGSSAPSSGEFKILVAISIILGNTASLDLSRKWYPETVHIPNTMSFVFVVTLLSFLQIIL